MIRNQKGFAAVEVLLVLLVVGLTGGIGWYVFQRQSSSASQDAQVKVTNFEECVAAGNPVLESSPEQCVANGQRFTNENNSSVGEHIMDLGDKGVELIQVSDVDKLPDAVPQSFRQYITKKLQQRIPSENGCIEVYSVKIVSEVNIRGNVGAADSDGNSFEGCGGGASMYWYLTDGGWRELAIQMMPSCKQLSETLIYKEFIPECFADESGAEMKENPNGSIIKVL